MSPGFTKRPKFHQRRMSKVAYFQITFKTLFSCVFFCAVSKNINHILIQGTILEIFTKKTNKIEDEERVEIC